MMIHSHTSIENYYEYFIVFFKPRKHEIESENETSGDNSNRSKIMRRVLETNYTTRVDISNSPFVNFQIWDFPGDIDFEDASLGSEAIFKQCGALIFVIDAQVCYGSRLLENNIQFINNDDYRTSTARL